MVDFTSKTNFKKYYDATDKNNLTEQSQLTSDSPGNVNRVLPQVEAEKR